MIMHITPQFLEEYKRKGKSVHTRSAYRVHSSSPCTPDFLIAQCQRAAAMGCLGAQLR